MDKNIIIDGVDVAGCEFAVKPINDDRVKCHCCKGLLEIAKMYEQPESVKNGLCKNNPNCYYKQLKRLEQENKRLEFELKVTKADYEASEQENKELKAYKDVNEDFKKAWDELNRKYTEVLKLAKENADSNEYCLQELEKENRELKEEKLYRGIDRQFIEDANDRLYFEAEKYRKALEEIKSAIVEYLPKKQGDYNFSKSLNPAQYALLEYIQIQINEVLK